MSKARLDAKDFFTQYSQVYLIKDDKKAALKKAQAEFMARGKWEIDEVDKKSARKWKVDKVTKKDMGKKDAANYIK